MLNWRKPIGATPGMVVGDVIVDTLKVAKSLLEVDHVNAVFANTKHSFPTEQERAAYQQGLQDCHAHHLKNFDNLILGYIETH
jgi:hypothetical protein